MAAGLACLVLPRQGGHADLLGGILAAAAAGCGIVGVTAAEGRLFAASGWLFVDACPLSTSP